jgi:hypothetical protein
MDAKAIAASYIDFTTLTDWTSTEPVPGYEVQLSGTHVVPPPGQDASDDTPGG